MSINLENIQINFERLNKSTKSIFKYRNISIKPFLNMQFTNILRAAKYPIPIPLYLHSPAMG